MSVPTRLLPLRPFPPYTYVPGQAPHPVSDPAGHMHGTTLEQPTLDVHRWWECDAYLWGIDLFNHGYYWEAHEAWEGVWHAAGRQGPVADFLKGLIKLAAAGVKAREKSATGLRRHLQRSNELFHMSRSALGEVVMGLNLAELISLASAADFDFAESGNGVPVRVFRMSLQPFQAGTPLSRGSEESR